MMNKIFCLYILFAFLSTAGIFVFADEPGSALDGKPSKEAIDKQAEEDYGQAVKLYKNKKFAEAKKKFVEISSILPDYRATMKYLDLIGRYVREKQEKALQEQRQQELKAQELKHREEKIKREEIIREETRHLRELERQERQRQAQLEARREAVRKQLEGGVEAMYKEALSLYKQGDYTAAADKFKDVQDILPGYKRAGQYMDESHRKSLTVTPQPVMTPDASAVPASPPASRDAVSKTLDLFNSNAQ